VFRFSSTSRATQVENNDVTTTLNVIKMSVKGIEFSAVVSAYVGRGLETGRSHS
jgi:hypothetical protein